MLWFCAQVLTGAVENFSALPRILSLRTLIAPFLESLTFVLTYGVTLSKAEVY